MKSAHRSADKKFSGNMIILCISGLLLNLCLAQLALFLQLPLYLDNIGSVLVAVLGGPIAGMTVGFLSNLTNSLTEPVTLYYGILTVLIAFIAYVFSYKGWFRRLGGVLCAAACFVIIGGAMGSCMTWFLYGGGIGEGISAPYAKVLLQMGLPEFWAQFTADVLIDIPDKMITVLAVYLFLKHYPEKLYDKFPYSYLYDRSEEECLREIRLRRSQYRKHSVTARILSIILVSLLGISVCSTAVGVFFARETAADASAAGLQSITLSYIIRMFAVQLALSILIIGYAAWYANRKVAGPVNSIVELSREFGRTDAEQWLESEAWQTKEDIHTGDEIEELYKTICREEENTVRNVIRLKNSEALERANEELAAATEEAREANRAKSVFLSRMSHDIRTPLNVIIGMTRLAMENENPEDTQECLEKVMISSKFLLGLVNDILDMEQIESGKTRLHPVPYSEEDFATYIETVIRPLCREKGITFTFTRKIEEQAPVMMDKLRINQVFFNLLSNAVKFTPEGGQVCLTVENHRVDDSRVEIFATVSDNGIGMSEEFQKHMFESFTQESRELTSASQGSGLGLSIVKHMCELMEMSISVESSPGRGTSCRLRGVFEIAPEPDISGPEQKEAADFVLLKDRHILVCEDHMLNQEIIKRVLQSRGMIPVIAENGQKGLEAFAGSAPGEFSVILMDVRMPVMDGLEATAAIRALDRPDAKTVPIIAMSANAYREDVQMSLDAGMNAHLSKPVENDILFQTIRKCLMDAGGALD